MNPGRAMRFGRPIGRRAARRYGRGMQRPCEPEAPIRVTWRHESGDTGVVEFENNADAVRFCNIVHATPGCEVVSWPTGIGRRS